MGTGEDGQAFCVGIIRQNSLGANGRIFFKPLSVSSDNTVHEIVRTLHTISTIIARNRTLYIKTTKY